MPDCLSRTGPRRSQSLGVRARLFDKGFFESFEVGAQAIDFRLEPDNGNGLHGLLFQHLLRDREQRFLIFQTTGDEIRLDRAWEMRASPPTKFRIRFTAPISP